MKVFAILFVIFVAALAEFDLNLYVAPGEITEDHFLPPGSRISGGDKAKKGENLSWGYATISFINKVVSCGVTLVDKQYALTSGRCCVDQQEGLASNSTVIFPQFNKKPIIGVSYIVPDGSNGADAAMEATLEAYDNTTDIPFSTVGPNNFCLIKLKTAFTDKQLDGKKLALAKFASATDWETFMTAYLAPTAGFTLRVIGIGVTDNNGKKSKEPLTTAFEKMQNSDDCTATTDGTTVTMPATDPDFGVCVSNPNTDKNVCKYDWGGGIFAVKLDEKGAQVKGSTPELLCILIGAPDIRANAQCQGGHKNICILVIGKVQEWVKGAIAGRMVPA